MGLNKNFRGGIRSNMGARYVKPDEDKKLLYVDTNNLYGWAVSQSLKCDEIVVDKTVKFRRYIKYSR